MTVGGPEERRWVRVAELFTEALDHPPAERRSFLEAACSGGEEGLRQELERLLAADDSAGAFLSEPVPLPGELPGEPQIPGGRAGPYRLLHRLGAGWVSSVWLAVRDDAQHRRRVAVKLLHRSLASDDQLRRWQREQQILASLEHPNIARLYDAGTTGEGHPYLAMEYVEGEPITEYCDRHRLTLDERIDLFLGLCAAVAFAHQNLILHRDIKPSNVLVTEGGVPKLLDFGIAKTLNPNLVEAGAPATVPWQRLLTPDYASPEQIAGKPMTTATDVYSLGVLLYELLAGRRPFHLTGLAPGEVERIVQEEEPEALTAAALRRGGAETAPEAVARARGLRPDQLRRRLAGDLSTIAAKALVKAPQRRYPTVEQLAGDLRRHRAGLPVKARSATLPYRVSRFLRRHRPWVGITAAFILVVLAAAVGLGVLSLRLARQRDRAHAERDKAQQVVAFLEEIFASSDPNRLQGDTLGVRQLLAHGARRAEGLSGQPEVQADLLTTIGSLYRRWGLLEEAEPLLHQALEVRRGLHGESHPAVAASLAELGKVKLELGELEAAEALQRRALDLRREALGDGDLETAQSRKDLAQVLEERGLYGEAESLVRRALDAERRSLGEESREVAASLNQLAGVLWERGVRDEAETLYRQALDLRRRLDGPGSLEVAQSSNDLALALMAGGRIEEPERLLQDALAINRRLLGEGHSDALSNLNNLASLATWARDFEKAEGLYRKALELGAEALGEDHPNLAYLLLGLGRCRTELGDPAGAEPHLRRALEIRHRVYPAGHFMTAKAELLLGASLAAQGRFAEAEPLLLAAHRVIAVQEPPRERELAAARRYLSDLYAGWGREERAAHFRELAAAAQAGAAAVAGSSRGSRVADQEPTDG